MKDKKHIFTLAFSIALLPPLWAVLSPYIGITTGSVALICAGLYVTNGNKVSDVFKIISGFLLGDIWALSAMFIMDKLPLNPNIELFTTLFLLGALAVLIGEHFNKFIFTPALLCGWAIGLTIMAAMPLSKLGTLPLQIAASMIVGVLYVGVGVDYFQKMLLRMMKK